jgi:hypothetical protein
LQCRFRHTRGALAPSAWGCLDLGQQFSNVVNERIDLALQHLVRLSVDDFAKRRQDALNRSQSECVKGDKHLVHVRNGLVQKEENWDVDRQTTLVYLLDVIEKEAAPGVELVHRKMLLNA